MAKNKHALIRYRALDKCLRNRRVRYGIQDLIAEVNKALEAYDPATKGVGRSTVYEDIAFLESTDGYRADIERVKEGRHTYLRYADPDFSIYNSPLSELELSQLQEAVRVLQQFKGMPQFEWLEEVSAKLNEGLTPEAEQHFISFDNNQYLKGIEYLGMLYGAIRYQKVLRISYQPFKEKDPKALLFHPYFLKQYNNRWFAFGHCPNSANPINNLALDRIQEVQEVADEFIPNTTVDFNEYFEDIIGVTRPVDGELQEIMLWIAPHRAGYVQTKPIHGSQKKITQDDSGLTISLELIINPEFLQLLFSFGSDIKVLSPESLQEQMLEESRKVHGHYAALSDDNV